MNNDVDLGVEVERKRSMEDSNDGVQYSKKTRATTLADDAGLTR
jgi:hypothetical protein